MSMLYEELAQSFPVEVVEPFGSVLVIPCKVFKNEWKPKLEVEGVKIFVQGFKGESCFFLRKHSQNEANSQNKAEVEVQPMKLNGKAWSETEIQEMLRLRKEGMSYRRIAMKINRNHASVYKKLKEYEKENRENPKSCNVDDDVVKEFLEACSLLYPSHKRACAFLLKEASNKIIEV